MTRIAVVVVLGLGTIVAALSSSQPARDPSQPTEWSLSNRGESIAEKYQKPKDNQAVSRQSPPVPERIKPEQPQSNGAQSGENIDINGQLAEYTRQLATFTKWLVGATVLIAAIGAYQACITRDTARRELRAYVAVVNAEMTDIDAPMAPGAKVTIKNSGKTPAYALTHVGGIKFPLPPTDADVASNVSQSRNDLGPGDMTFVFTETPRQLSDTEKEELRKGTEAIYVYGLINYRDAFRKKRFTKYCFMTGGKAGVRGIYLAVCEEGNEAN